MGNQIVVDATDLKAALSLLDAYARKEGKGSHFKDNEQRLPDAFYVVRIANLERALNSSEAGASR